MTDEVATHTAVIDDYYAWLGVDAQADDQSGARLFEELCAAGVAEGEMLRCPPNCRAW